MDESATLRGTELRYALTMFLLQHGPTSIPDMIAGLTSQGFVIVGHPPKSVSDALRWEMEHCRVYRRRRGVGCTRRGTRYRGPRSTAFISACFH
ncbi:MAG: hypothetical protein M3O32_02910 [Actinomycetota bacterium]|nr:hypothetical protein [Actinomycetota bacterium]